MSFLLTRIRRVLADPPEEKFTHHVNVVIDGEKIAPADGRASTGLLKDDFQNGVALRSWGCQPLNRGGGDWRQRGNGQGRHDGSRAGAISQAKKPRGSRGRLRGRPAVGGAPLDRRPRPGRSRGGLQVAGAGPAQVQPDSAVGGVNADDREACRGLRPRGGAGQDADGAQY